LISDLWLIAAAALLLTNGVICVVFTAKALEWAGTAGYTGLPDVPEIVRRKIFESRIRLAGFCSFAGAGALVLILFARSL
jgi:hypothetical protein